MRRIILPLLLLALITTHFSYAQTDLPDGVQEMRITTVRANVHTCARLDCEVVASYAAGTPLFVLGSEQGDAVRDDPTWYRLRDSLTGDEVYISGALTAVHAFDDWQLRPVYPLTVSDAMKAVYQRGLASGNNPDAFSKGRRLPERDTLLPRAVRRRQQLQPRRVESAARDD